MGRRLTWDTPAATPYRAPSSNPMARQLASALDAATPVNVDPVKELAAPQVAPSRTAHAAELLGLDLASECPVCRSLEPCECDEEDRSFVLRTRHEHDVKRVPLCQVCLGPLSVIYVRRRGVTGPPPYRLSQFSALWGCAGCEGDGLAGLAEREAQRLAKDLM